ncbi:MAG: spirocyclase, AveC family [Nevskia sp.]|nr:spirocyclase, AveC family [Nevskia sp.]
MNTISSEAAGSRRTSVVANSLAQHSVLNPTLVWAALGAFFIVLQIYVFGSWIAGGGAKPIVPNPADVPDYTRYACLVFQIFGVGACIAGAIYVIRRSIKEGRLSFDAMLFIGGALAGWADPISNFIRPQFFGSSAMVNLQSWGPYIPGWLAPRAEHYAEPILLTAPFGYSQVFLWVPIVACLLMQWARRRWPNANVLRYVLVAWVFCGVSLLLEELVMNRLGVQAYPGSERSLAIWSGETYQYPIYNPILWGAVWVATAALRFFRDDRGRSVVERGADELQMSESTRTTVRLLAVTGFINVLLIGYGLALAFVNLVSPNVQTPSGYASHLHNYMCGEGTPMACPGPSVPIPIRGSQMIPPG